MAFIAVNELTTSGKELFEDSESYLNDFNNVDTVQGSQFYGTAGYGGFGGTFGIYGLVSKGYEFGVNTLGIEAISHIVKSFSYGGYSTGGY